MRKKLKLAFMVSDFARRITYNKRKKSLNYSEPELWPSPWEVQRIITKYKNYSEFEKCIKKLNHKSYLMQRIIQRAIGKTGGERLANGEVVLDLVLMSCPRKFDRHFELKCFEWFNM
jgi:hypothetical protein